MYSFISGKIKSVSATSVVLENQGMGFHIQISLHTFSAIKDLKETTLYTYCVIKTETQAFSQFAIFGFSDEQEKKIFLELISVSGVGNNTAQLILSSFTPGELVNTIASGDVASLQKVKGIGTKTAQRIIVDLKDKIGKATADFKITSVPGNTVKEESLSALLTLGFSRGSSEKAVEKALRELASGAEVENVIKAALNYLAS